MAKKKEFFEHVGEKDLSMGLKWDKEKLDWSLLDISLLEPIVYRYTKGAQKYGPWNWCLLENGKERYYAAAMRHLVAYRKGEIDDPDPQFAEHPSHMAAVIWNLLCLLYFEREEARKLEEESEKGE